MQMDPTKNGEQSQDTSSTQEQQSVQEILALGEQASQLLNSPVYNVMYNLQLRNVFSQFLETSPKEVNKREGLYHEAQGLINLTEKMGGLVEEAQRVLREQEEKRDPRRAAADYEDRQGFGLN
jgi:hypothetical protein